MTARRPEAAAVERRSGVALWRQIADSIRTGLTADLADADGRLPPESALADTFGVNRHTVRAALRALADEGVVEARQGSGTFVRDRRRLTYPIAPRTRFSAGLEGQAEARLAVLDTQIRPAPADVAGALAMPVSGPAVRIESMGLADGVAVSRSTSWFDASRFPSIGEAVARTGSITRALGEAGIDDYLRKTTRIEARHGQPGDLEALNLSPGAIVLVTEALNAEPDGRPLHYAVSRFAADRVTLEVRA